MDPFSVHVHNLSKAYGTRRVFCDISFSHRKGVLGIAGPNGSGKSTLLQCLAGLKRPSSGFIEWQSGTGLIKPKTVKKNLGYAAPYINLYSELSCAENLHFLLDLRGVKDREYILEKIIDRVGMASLASQPFGKLSTGQQQRMCLAAALIHQPDILMLDEPGANLDEAGRRLVKSLVDEFNEPGKLVIIASNNPNELAWCDEVYSVEGENFL